MKEASGTILYKEWLPDLPAYGNPGLVEALNCLPTDRTYKRFAPLFDTTAFVPARPVGAFSGSRIYAGTGTQLYMLPALGNFTLKSAATYNVGSEGWQFAQFEDMVIAVTGGELPQAHTADSASNFTTIGSAETAEAVGVVGQFLVLGNVGGVANRVRWSSIGDPLDFQTANSATAIARQSGQEDLQLLFGTVNAIAGGDQFAVVIQARALTRVTYIGGDNVFQFDRYADNVGSRYPHSVVRAGERVYFADSTGFYVTDGVSVRDISAGKIRKFWESQSVSNAHKVYGAHFALKKQIWWGFPDLNHGNGTQNAIVIYNYEEDRWTHADQDHECLFTHGDSLEAFRNTLTTTGASTLGSFSLETVGAAAIFETGEIEGVPGGFTDIQGARPLVDGATINGVTSQIGSRNDLQTAVSYSAATTVTARTGVCDHRVSARYLRHRLTVAGTFNSAIGIQYLTEQSGVT